MTKKDYVMIARSLAVIVETSYTDLRTISMTIDQLALDMKRDNPQFNRELFNKELYWHCVDLSFSLYRDRKDARITNIMTL